MVDSSSMELTKLKNTASNNEILEAMKHSQNGVGFLTQHPSLPSQTFVSADAVQWLNNHIEGGVTVENAINIMNVKIIFYIYKEILLIIFSNSNDIFSFRV